MKKEHVVGAIIGIIVISGGSFYAGMNYGQGLTGVKGARTFSGIPGGMMGGTRGTRTGGGFTGGEVISKDDKSVTVKLQTGGSKIVFLSDATTVSKSVSGAPTDIAVGAQVMVSGTANSDGSITAQSVQIRPTQPAKAN